MHTHFVKMTVTGGVVSTRERILDAAAHVMRERGLAHATTKQIAKQSGYSEAALYKHFQSKTELCLAVIQERTPGGFSTLLGQLPDRVGQRPLRDELVTLARAAVEFYSATFTMMASLFSDPPLLDTHRHAMRELGAGPHTPRVAVGEYLAREQRHHRINPAVDPHRAADLLLGPCLQQAFLLSYGERELATHDDFAESLVDTLVAGIHA